MIKYYCGAGARITPTHICTLMTKFAIRIANDGYILRSGAGKHADSAFERGCKDVDKPMQIFLPWPGFRNRPDTFSYIQNPSSEAFSIAASIRPNFHRFKHTTQKLFARTVHMVLGRDLRTFSKFVMCWTTGSGGTQFTVDLAREYGIKVYNLADDKVYERVAKYVYSSVNKGEKL